MAPVTQYLPGYWNNRVPAGYQIVNAAEPAGGVVMPPQRAIAQVPSNQNNFTNTALNVAEMGTGLLAQGVKNAAWTTVGKFAAPATVALSAYNANSAANTDKQALIDQFRDEIAANQNISPDQVNETHLQEAAKHSPILAERMSSMQQQIFTKPLQTAAITAVGIGTGLLTGGLGWIPMLAISLSASTAASYGADALAKNAGFIPPEYTAKANLDVLVQARKEGKEITGSEIFTLFAKANEKLGKLVEDRAGTTAENASPEVLAEVMRHYHENLNASCEELAKMINRNEVKPEVLAFIDPEKLTVSHSQALQKLKEQAVNGNIPQNMVSADGLVYDGKGVSYLAANTNRPVVGQFTGRVAAEQNNITPTQSI